MYTRVQDADLCILRESFQGPRDMVIRGSGGMEDPQNSGAASSNEKFVPQKSRWPKVEEKKIKNNPVKIRDTRYRSFSDESKKLGYRNLSHAYVAVGIY